MLLFISLVPFPNLLAFNQKHFKFLYYIDFMLSVLKSILPWNIHSLLFFCPQICFSYVLFHNNLASK